MKRDARLWQSLQIVAWSRWKSTSGLTLPHREQRR
jgi:hypothetical protein